MKRLFFLYLILLLHYDSFSQYDSHKDSCIMEVRLENPQPRQGQLPQIAIKAQNISDAVYNSFSSADKMKIGRSFYDELPIGYLRTDKLGKFTIGGSKYNINGETCYIKGFSYQVVDSLPNVSEGLWIRLVNFDENKNCLIIEQRIRTNSKDSISKDKSPYEYRARLKKEFFEKFDPLSILYGRMTSRNGIINETSSVETYFESTDILWFRKTKPERSIKLGAKDFENLPPGYKFQEIEF